MSRYLTPRTVFVIIKFWTMGATVFTFGVVLCKYGSTHSPAYNLMMTTTVLGVKYLLMF